MRVGPALAGIFTTPVAQADIIEFEVRQRFRPPRVPVPVSWLTLCAPVTQRGWTTSRSFIANVGDAHDAHVVAGLVKRFLFMLPDSLLTFERFDAFTSCATLPNDSATDARARNLRILVNDLPTAHKCVLATQCAACVWSLKGSVASRDVCGFVCDCVCLCLCVTGRCCWS